MSAVQALAALLSANADAGSRVAASALAANASNANANAALQGDIYRSNIQGQVAHRGIDADMQRFVGEQALRSMLGKQQMGIEAGRLGLGREQLGLNRQQLNQERDFRLGEIGRGPYAPNAPAAPAAGGEGGGLMGLLQGLLGGGQKQGQGGGDMQERARQMIMANPGDPRVMQMWGPILNQGVDQQRWQQEFDWKKGAVTDPNVLFANIAPSIAGIEGVNSQNFGSVLSSLKEGLSGRTPSPAATAPAAGSPVPWSEETAVSEGYKADPIIAQLGIHGQDAGSIANLLLGQEGRGLFNDPSAMARIAEYLQFRKRQDPSFGQARTYGGQKVFGEGDTLMHAILNGGDVPAAIKEALSKHRGAVNRGYNVSDIYSNLPLGAGGF
ncbi:MAG: hypothetical protein C0483_18745 [Pirellula sp.]|nr:hypothetical protein [Pirellula sp.]